MQRKAGAHARLSHRIAHEVKQYAAISLYLYVCFAAVLFYKAAALQAQGIEYAPYGVAVIKALILAKFLLIGHAIGVGDRYGHRRLIFRVLQQSLVFLVVLVVLMVAEETIRGLVAGRTLIASVEAIAGGTWLQFAATCLLMWLVLLPYFAFRQVGQIIGEDKLRDMFLAAH